jgi:thymidine phosphorylase
MDAATHPGEDHSQLRLRNLGIDTQQEHVIYMRRDCHVCRAEGFQSQARVKVLGNGRHLIATLNVIDGDLLQHGEAALSHGAARALDVHEGDQLAVSHAPTLDSFSALRTKIYGHRLNAVDLNSIVGDIAKGYYSNIHLAAFLSACSGGRMDLQETIDLTRAMVGAGERINWGTTTVADKHCVGGLPGNRTTPIVVAIAAAAGLTMPKTSSRAITSPAGTADVMETITNVTLDLPSMRRVVEREGACLAWGGGLALSPADDLLIRVERPLDIDSDAQLVASVLSKKIAAGATHVVLDIPIGPTAKVRDEADARALTSLLTQVGDACGLRLHIRHTRGSQPVGRGIGPALEAHDVMAVLRGAAHAPLDLRSRALNLAGDLLEFCGEAQAGTGRSRACRILDSGMAWQKFQGICEAQGVMHEPGVATLREPVLAEREGHVAHINNRRLSRLAKLLGAPTTPTAGLEMQVELGTRVQKGQPLFILHAEAPGELAYAREYLDAHPILEVMA